MRTRTVCPTVALSALLLASSTLACGGGEGSPVLDRARLGHNIEDIEAITSGSLDGYVADPDDYLGGDDGHRLHNWFAPSGESAPPSGPTQKFFDEWQACGAVVAGRRTAELMDHWGGDHGGAPIFVPSHRPPPPAARWGYPLVTYVADGIASARGAR